MIWLNGGFQAPGKGLMGLSIFRRRPGGSPALSQRGSPALSQPAALVSLAVSFVVFSAVFSESPALAATEAAGGSSPSKPHASKLADSAPAQGAAKNPNSPSSAAPAAQQNPPAAAQSAPSSPAAKAPPPSPGASRAGSSQKRSLASGGGAAASFVNEEGETLKFAGEKPPSLSAAQAQNLWNRIQAKLSALREYCSGSRPSAKKTKSLAAQLQMIQRQAAAVYEKHKYSFSGAKIKISGQTAGLGPVLLDISSILQIQYGQIQKSASLPAACRALKDSFIYSLYSYYNIPDEADLNQRLSHWARTVLSAVKCACPEQR